LKQREQKNFVKENMNKAIFDLAPPTKDVAAPDD